MVALGWPGVARISRGPLLSLSLAGRVSVLPSRSKSPLLGAVFRLTPDLAGSWAYHAHVLRVSRTFATNV